MALITIQRNVRRYASIAASATMLVGMIAAAAPASAATFDGVLGVHGPGSTFAGTDKSGITEGALVTAVVAPGGVATLPAEVINKGTALAQFKVTISDEDHQSIPQLLAGKVDVTTLAEGPGYVTPPLAPGKAQALTVKLTVPSNANSAEGFFALLSLSSVDGATFLGSVDVGAAIKGSTGTTGHDMFVTSASQPTVGGSPETLGDQYLAAVTAPTIKTNGVATYNVTVKNDSTVTAAGDEMGMLPPFCAPNSWVVTIKAGTVDVTSAVLAETYVLPAIAPGKSVKLTVTVQAVAPLPTTVGCANVALASLGIEGASGPSDDENVFLIANVV